LHNEKKEQKKEVSSSAGTARIIFDPIAIKGNTFKEFWIIAVTENDLGDYYKDKIEREFFLKKWINIFDCETRQENINIGLRIQRPAWGAHISVVRGEAVDLNNEFKNKYNNKAIQFEYNVYPITSGEHWWLEVNCPELLDLRENLGLPRDPRWNLHLTIGSAIPAFREKNEYIYRMRYGKF
jgi:hypothetical protein